jgi:hypothetical protein
MEVELTNKVNDIMRELASNDSTRTSVDFNRDQAIKTSIKKASRKLFLGTKMELSIHFTRIRKTRKTTLKIGGASNNSKHSTSKNKLEESGESKVNA